MQKSVYEFISKKTNDPIVQWRTCRLTGEEFAVTQKDTEFYESIGPVIAGKRYSLPLPTLCPDARQQRRLSWRNERKLYKRKCDATGREIISIYSPDKPYKVFHQEFWWSDRWNALKYGRSFDFTRPFFEQFDEFLQSVPLPSLSSIGSENCEYSQLFSSKDCYYSFTGWLDEDVHLSTWMVSCQDCVDCLRCSGISNSYNCVHCYESCTNLTNCYNCYTSSFCTYCWNLRGCEYCYMSGNLTNARYVWRGEQLEKEEFMQRWHDVDQEKMAQNRTEWLEHIKNSAVSAHQNFECENTTGNLNKHCRDSQFCYEITSSTNCKYFYDNSGRCHDLMDCTFGSDGTKCYEMVIVGGHNSAFTFFSWPDVENLFYSIWCGKSKDCFGCVSLRNAQYCIFNKQYSKEEYESLVPRIIEHMRKNGEWGEYFPSKYSPFGYQETMAEEYYPLTREKILGPWHSNEHTLEHGEVFNWSDYEAPFPMVAKIIPAAKLPSSIDEIPDDILSWAIECEVSEKPFRIIREELEFYRKHSIPIPKRHPDQRNADRVKIRPGRTLYLRRCDISGEEILSVYPPDYPGKVVSETEYLKLQN